MDGFTPAEEEICDANAASGTPEQKQRAAWFTDVRRVLDIIEHRPGLPLPWANKRDITISITTGDAAEARRQFAKAEAALSAGLGVTFTPRPESCGGQADFYYILGATLPSGLKLDIRAYATDVAEQQITGQTVTDITEWVRKPVEDPEPAPAGTEAA